MTEKKMPRHQTRSRANFFLPTTEDSKGGSLGGLLRLGDGHSRSRGGRGDGGLCDGGSSCGRQGGGSLGRLLRLGNGHSRSRGGRGDGGLGDGGSSCGRQGGGSIGALACLEAAVDSGLLMYRKSESVGCYVRYAKMSLKICSERKFSCSGSLSVGDR